MNAVIASFGSVAFRLERVAFLGHEAMVEVGGPLNSK